MSMKLYVGNLLFQTTSSDLAQLFKQVGAIESAQVVTSQNGQSCGYGFVIMGSREEGEAAIVRFNNQEYNGSQLIVNEEPPPKAQAAGISLGSSQYTKKNSYAASRAVRWQRL